MITKSKVQELKTLVNKADKIVIIPHVSPDGDAMGASLGLYHTLRSVGKEVTVILPSSFPRFLNWMPDVSETINFETDLSKVKDQLTSADLLFFLDFNCMKRIGKLADEVEKVKCSRVMIDHHPYPDQIGDIMISVPAASSTSELIYSVISALEWSNFMTKEAAECLYLGIMTDTGALSYNSSNPDTYRTVADLLEKGIEKDRIHELVFHSNSFYRMKLLGYVLGDKMSLMPDFGAAYFGLDKKELEDHHFQQGDTEGFVNYPLGIEGINISAFFMEKDDMVKCSFRSRGDFPVNLFSEQHFNGGGHRNAAGGESYVSLKETIDKFKIELPKFYLNYINNAK